VESKESNTQEANRLYWQTEKSVGDIAEELGVSRRALYELVQPESSGTTCNECGGDVAFTNRSARTSGLGRCQQCGAQSELTELPPDVHETMPPYVAGWPRVQPAAPDDALAARAVRIGGVALAGAAVGAVATLLITRRR
jgi:hypothetical protein